MTTPANSASLPRRELLTSAASLAAIATLGGTASAAYARQQPPPPAPPPVPPATQLTAAEPPQFQRLRVGSVSVVALSDGGATSPGSPHPTFAPEATPEQVDAALRSNFRPTDRYRSYFNVTHITLGDQRILVDVGGGGLMGPVGGRLRANMAAAGLDADAVTAIILTHAHLDHFGGLLNAQGQVAFPNATLYVSKAEHDFWTSAAPDLSGLRLPDDAKASFIAMAQRHLAAFKDRLALVAPGDRLWNDLELVDGSGHTPGHMPVRLRSGNESLLVLADLAHHDVLNFTNPDWTVAFDADPRAAAATRKRIFARCVDERTRILAYHMPWPGVGFIAAEGTGYRWVPQPWGSDDAPPTR